MLRVNGASCKSIALAHYSACDDVSGVTTFLSGLIKSLVSAGNRVALHCQHFGDNPLDSEFTADMREIGVEVDAIRRPVYMEDAVRSTLSFLARVRPHVFLPQCLPAHFYAAAIAGSQGLPWFYTVHSDDPEYWACLGACQPQSHSGRVVAVSDAIGREVTRRTNTKCEIIPYGVATASSRVTEASSGRFRVIFSGRVTEKQKRSSLVLEAMIAACKQDPSIECRVIGDGDARPALQNMVARNALEGRIVFRGRVKPELMYQELSQAQSILFMSDYEGLPVALLEAMALGVVPVARLIPSGIPEAVLHEQTGLLTTDNPLEAAQSLIRLSQDQALWTSCSRAAQRIIGEKFSHEVCHSRWHTLINNFSCPSPVQVQRVRKLNLPPVSEDLSGIDVRRPAFTRLAAQKFKALLRKTGFHLPARIRAN